MKMPKIFSDSFSARSERMAGLRLASETFASFGTTERSRQLRFEKVFRAFEKVFRAFEKVFRAWGLPAQAGRWPPGDFRRPGRYNGTGAE